MTQSQNIQDAFEAVAIDIIAIQSALAGQTSAAGTLSSAEPHFQYPISPVALLPPDPAEPLPASLQQTYPANPLKASTPVDIRLACHDLNNFDLALSHQLDLYTDNTLNTAIVISLFTDRYDPETKTGGYWGDEATENTVLMGSRLWKLQRAKVTTEALRSAEDYADEALQWMLDDKLIISLETVASWQYINNKHQLTLSVVAMPTPGSPYGSKRFNQNYIVAGG